MAGCVLTSALLLSHRLPDPLGPVTCSVPVRIAYDSRHQAGGYLYCLLCRSGVERFRSSARRCSYGRRRLGHARRPRNTLQARWQEEPAHRAAGSRGAACAREPGRCSRETDSEPRGHVVQEGSDARTARRQAQGGGGVVGPRRASPRTHACGRCFPREKRACASGERFPLFFPLKAFAQHACIRSLQKVEGLRRLDVCFARMCKDQQTTPASFSSTRRNVFDPMCRFSGLPGV